MHKTVTLRLEPGVDLRKCLENWAIENQIDAAAIVTCVGSFKKVQLRFAGADESFPYEGKYEIISCVGTVSKNGLHIHVGVSDKHGQCIGGHLMNDSCIYTTAEIVLLVMDDVIYTREKDPKTGYPELCVTIK